MTNKLHVTFDTFNLTGDTWREENIISKRQVHMFLECFKDLEETDQLLNELMNEWTRKEYF